MNECKPLNKNMWGYFAPDGYLQVRSIGLTRKESRRFVAEFEDYDYKDYEKRGYKLEKISVNIAVLTRK